MRNLVFAAIAALVLVCPAAHAQAVSGAISSTTCLGTGGGSLPQETGCVAINVSAAVASVDAQIGNPPFQSLLVFEGTTDYVTWYPLAAYPQPTGVATSSTGRPGIFVIDPQGSSTVRVRPLSLDSGTPQVTLRPSSASPVPTVIGISGIDPAGAQRPIAVSPQGVTYVLQASPPLNPFLPRCNAVRTTQCQP